MTKTLKALTPILAILVIGALEAYAISRGINGVILAGAVAVIAGLGGYEIKSLRKP